METKPPDGPDGQSSKFTRRLAVVIALILGLAASIDACMFVYANGGGWSRARRPSHSSRERDHDGRHGTVAVATPLLARYLPALGATCVNPREALCRE